MNEYIQTAILAVVQGITEFLPISSSGHLALGSKLLGMDGEGSAGMAIVLHGGSLLAIMVFYRRQICELLTVRGLKQTLVPLIIGSIPAALVGVPLKMSKVFDSAFESMFLVGCCFLVTAAILFFAFRKPAETSGETINVDKVSLKQAILIGCAQALAILPGISRSGSTIAAGTKNGLNRQSAAAFSFLLALPAIGGALLLHLKDVGQMKCSIGVLGFGFALSALTGLAALKFLVITLKKGKFEYFGYYLLIPAALAFLSSFGII